MFFRCKVEMLKRIKDFVEEKKRRIEERREAQRIELQEAFSRGMHLFQLRLYEEALQDFLACEKKLSLFDEGGRKDVLVNSGNCLFNLGRYGEGEKRYSKALKLDGSDFGVLRSRGLAHLTACNFEVLEDDVKVELKELKSKVRWALNGKEKMRVADEYLDLKRRHDFSKKHLSKAFDCFTRLVKLDCRNADCWYYFGLCCFFTDHKREAADSFEAVLMIEPTYSNDFMRVDLFERIKESRGDSVAFECGKKGSAGKYRTDRGVFVRSKAEALIDNFYFSHGIKAKYEPTLFLGGRTVMPDWELDLGGVIVYHEHFGMDTPAYLRVMNVKIDLYQKHGKNLVWTTKDDEGDIANVLKRKLSAFNFEQGGADWRS